MAVKDSYTKILLNFNDSNNILLDECEENIWSASGNISLEKNLFSSTTCAYFNNSGTLYLNECIPISDSSITYEFWIYIIEGHFGFSSDRAYRDDCICLCVGNEGIGYDTGVTSYYSGQYVVAGSKETNLISLNEWHYITLSVSEGKNHYISIDGNIVYSGFNSRGYSVNYLPSQLGSVPTWAYGRSNSFPFKGYIKGFRISSGIARYTSNFECPVFPNAPGQNTAINISIPNSEKSGSFKAKNGITYYYQSSYSKISNYQVQIFIYYRKADSDKINFSSSTIEFTFDNFRDSESLILSKTNSEINSLKEYLNKIIDTIDFPEEYLIKYKSENTGITHYIKQSYSSVNNTITSCRVVLNTYYGKDSSSVNNRFSIKIISVNAENYSQLQSDLMELSESELTSCKEYLDTLIDPNILIPDTKYRNIKAKNGDIYYLRLSYSLGQVSNTLANINYKTSWSNIADFKYTFSSKSFYIDSDNYSSYFNLVSKLGENELAKCAKMFDNISTDKIMIRGDSTKNIITYITSENDFNEEYLGLLKDKNNQRIFCKITEENKITSKNDSSLAIKKDNNIYYIRNDF